LYTIKKVLISTFKNQINPSLSIGDNETITKKYARHSESGDHAPHSTCYQMGKKLTFFTLTTQGKTHFKKYVVILVILSLLKIIFLQVILFFVQAKNNNMKLARVNCHSMIFRSTN
jgi:hypothetical protein